MKSLVCSCVSTRKIPRKSRSRAAISLPKSRRIYGNPAALIGDIPGRVVSLYDYVINHTQIAHVCVINTDASAGLNRGLDDLPCLVHNVTAAVENIASRVVRTILANNERFGRLITGSGTFFSRCSDDCSGYLNRFRCGCSLFLIRRVRLGECQRRNQQTPERDNCLLYHIPPYFPFIVLGLFDFSLSRTHFCLITEYSVELRAALQGNFGDCGSSASLVAFEPISTSLRFSHPDNPPSAINRQSGSPRVSIRESE